MLNLIKLGFKLREGWIDRNERENLTVLSFYLRAWKTYCYGFHGDESPIKENNHGLIDGMDRWHGRFNWLKNLFCILINGKSTWRVTFRIKVCTIENQIAPPNLKGTLFIPRIVEIGWKSTQGWVLFTEIIIAYWFYRNNNIRVDIIGSLNG